MPRDPSQMCMLVSLLAVLAAWSADAIESWKGGEPSIHDLWDEYSDIFPSGNRNAASHKWAHFILERSAGMDPDAITQLFRGFCAVSGSPVTPSSHTRYKYTLPGVAGDAVTGFVYHCCPPCVCDTQEFIRVDTKTIQTASGLREFNFQVIGNPCSSPSFDSIYNALWDDPFMPSQKSSLARSAPDVNCNGKILEDSVVSDNGNIIVGMVLDEPDDFEGMGFSDVATETPLQEFCVQRKEAGYNSGMGVIFAKVANITRPKVSAPQEEKKEVKPEKKFELRRVAWESGYLGGVLLGAVVAAAVVGSMGVVVAFKLKRARNPVLPRTQERNMGTDIDDLGEAMAIE